MTDAPVQQSFSGMPQRLYAASPSRLLAWLDCPRRYRMQYLDRPRPAARPQRAHTSVGVATHKARLYPRVSAMLLIAGALILLLPLPLGGIVFAAALAWMGYVLFTGRDEEAPQPTRA